MNLTVELSTPITGSYKQPIGLFINNEWVEGACGTKFEVINPATEEVITSVCEATEKDVDIAVLAARNAFETTWRRVAAHERSKMLLKLADICTENSELLAAVESLDSGKSITVARGNVRSAIKCLRYYGGWADKIMGQTKDVSPNMLSYTKREPIGVCGQIIPWNFPLLMFAWKIGPALATGNCVVIKSAEQTPLSALLCAQYIKLAGFPAGVFNLLSGFGKTVGATVASHMDIDKVAFTGSNAVGRQIMQAAARSNLKSITLELGGKSPNVVFNDADIENAVKWVHHGVFYNQGQCCCAGTRVFVQEGIYEEFLQALKKRCLEHKVGDPFLEDTFQGPQISQAQYDGIMGYIQQGKEEGATIEAGGERFGNKGYFIQPTIFSNVTPGMAICREEIFGPVCSIAKFKDESDAISQANDTIYGLAAALHTRDLNRAIRVSDALRAGTVWINCYTQHVLIYVFRLSGVKFCYEPSLTMPAYVLDVQMEFGGFRQSGIGRELGEMALSNYTECKSVGIMLEGEKL